MIAGLWRQAPPRLVVRTTIATFAVVALVLTAVLALIALQGRSYVRAAVVERLAAGQRMLSALEQRQSRELEAQVAVLAENPTLKAAIDTYRAELSTPDSAPRVELVSTIRRELDKLAARIGPDVIAVSDPSGLVLAASGRRKGDWPAMMPAAWRSASETVIVLPAGAYRRVAAPIVIHDTELGVLEMAMALDQRYAERLSLLSGTNTLVVADGRLIATTLTGQARAALSPALFPDLAGSSTISLAGTQYAVQLLFQPGAAAVYALDSIDDSTAPVVAQAMSAMLWLSTGAFALAGISSLWMARTLSRPIDTLSRSLEQMAHSRAFGQDLQPTGYCREVDALTRTFNAMMQSVSAAEAETRSACLGSIRALALALDARDPYTAGHSERVSAISVAIGRQLALADDELEVLRLGALLHDIGKIGVSDDVLRKPGALTPEEFEMIREHPGLGARIMRSMPFLAAHLPIVELHHERPDGRGYPYGLTSEQTPLSARIVHVADAFDAMTSARAYRPARPASDAVRELWRFAGTQFDAEAVQALVLALPGLAGTMDGGSESILRAAAPAGALAGAIRS